MSVNNSWDRVPGPDTPYGAMLTYWMDRLGISNRALALGVGIDRTYPGHIKSGRKTPHIDIANKIRNYLLAVAQEPGPTESPRLTEPEWADMDDLLQQSFDLANTARARRKQHTADGVKVSVVYPSARTTGPLQEDVPNPTEGSAAVLDDRDTSAVDDVVIPEPVLPGARELEELIELTGDDPAADELVRSRLQGVHLLALGLPDESGLAHLLHCTVTADGTRFPMLPVFTRREYIVAAVRTNPDWREYQVVEVDGEVALGALGPDEFLGINPWSDRGFRLSATRPITLDESIQSLSHDRDSSAGLESKDDGDPTEVAPAEAGFWADLKRSFRKGWADGRGR